MLFGKREHLRRLQPYKLRVATEELPYRWETGTQNHEAMAGTIAAVGYIEELGRRLQPGATRRRDAIYNTADEVDRAVAELGKLARA